MFTGLVECVGQITQVECLNKPLSNTQGANTSDTPAQYTDAEHANNSGVRLHVHAPSLGMETVRLGDSIAIEGACMTVTALKADGFAVEVSQESLSKTVGLDRVGPVNLEQAMRLGDRIGGHLVSGHVDGLGAVTHFAPVGESWHLQVRVGAGLAPCLAYKGSVAINGVSLTINQVDDHSGGSCTIHINIIPHTLTNTTLKGLQVGDAVNLEVDQLARYCLRIAQHQQAISPGVR